jgi:hypothetical protein
MSAKRYMCARIQMMARVRSLFVPLVLALLLGACNRQNHRSPSFTSAPGAEVTLTILRDGCEQQVRATPGEFTPQVEQGG